MDLLGVPIIMAIVYGIIEAIKLPLKNNQKFMNFVPLIAGVLGIVLGVVAFYAVPEIITTENVLYAILLGLASGLSATGCNQIVKQMSSFSCSKKEESNKKTQDTKETDKQDTKEE